MDLDTEFAFTPWEDSCRDPHPTIRQCRRPRGHDGDHAAGWGERRITWPQED
jgi:hypothetical protein